MYLESLLAGPQLASPLHVGVPGDGSGGASQSNAYIQKAVESGRRGGAELGRVKLDKELPPKPELGLKLRDGHKPD